jgi:hypothetical protein
VSRVVCMSDPAYADWPRNLALLESAGIEVFVVDEEVLT